MVFDKRKLQRMQRRAKYKYIFLK